MPDGVLKIGPESNVHRAMTATHRKFISTFSTLHPGDLVTGGTPPAGPCGAGDVIEGEIEGIGTLRVRLDDRPVDPRWQVVIADRGFGER